MSAQNKIPIAIEHGLWKYDISFDLVPEWKLHRYTRHVNTPLLLNTQAY